MHPATPKIDKNSLRYFNASTLLPGINNNTTESRTTLQHSSTSSSAVFGDQHHDKNVAGPCGYPAKPANPANCRFHPVTGEHIHPHVSKSRTNYFQIPHELQEPPMSRIFSNGAHRPPLQVVLNHAGPCTYNVVFECREPSDTPWSCSHYFGTITAVRLMVGGWLVEP